MISEIFLCLTAGERCIDSCSSGISISEGNENKKRLQTFSIDNAWSKKLNIHLTFRMLQHAFSEVTVLTIAKI